MLIDWYLHKIEYFLLCEWCEDMFNTHIESNQSKNVPIDMKCRMKMEKAMQAVMLEAM